MFLDCTVKMEIPSTIQTTDGNPGHECSLSASRQDDPSLVEGSLRV